MAAPGNFERGANTRSCRPLSYARRCLPRVLAPRLWQRWQAARRGYSGLDRVLRLYVSPIPAWARYRFQAGFEVHTPARPGACLASSARVPGRPGVGLGVGIGMAIAG